MGTRRNLFGIMGGAIALLAIVLAVIVLLKRQTSESPSVSLPSEQEQVERGHQPERIKPTAAAQTATSPSLWPEYEAKKTPVWGAVIEPVVAGIHRYWFYVDEKQIADSLNPPPDSTERVSVFAWPPVAGDRGTTIPRGEV